MSELDMQLFGERLKKLRLTKKLSMDDMVAGITKMCPCNISKSNISRWESGNSVPTLEYTVVLAKFFGVSADYLAGLTDMKTPKTEADKGNEKEKKMTLAEFTHMLYTTPVNWRSYTVSVFRDEESAYDWMQDVLCGEENHCAEPFCTLHSDMKISTYLKEEVCNSKVWKVYAAGTDQFVVVIDY